MSKHPTSQQDGARHSGQRSALDWVAETVGNDVLLHELHARARRRGRRRTVGAVAAIAALALCFVTLRDSPRSAQRELGPPNQLQVSLPRQQVLPDGSVAELREGAQIELDFSGAQRRVTLRQGEAHFSVQSDPAKPFIVHAAGVEVRAVGTAFAVQLAERGVEVLVTEGQVAVDRAAATATVSHETPPLAVVAAGEGTLIETPTARELQVRSPQVTAIKEADMTERLAWRVPRLEFSGTPLDLAVEAFNRHSKVKLVIGDPALARLKVSGIVRADQADALVSLLAANFDVTAERQGNQAVLLRRAR